MMMMKKVLGHIGAAVTPAGKINSISIHILSSILSAYWVLSSVTPIPLALLVLISSYLHDAQPLAHHDKCKALADS
jgi:hypothetical protein